MENKNMITRFCRCKPSKKITLSLIKYFTVSYKKREASGLTPNYTEYQNVKWQINCGKNYQNINKTQCEIYKLGLLERKRSIQ